MTREKWTGQESKRELEDRKKHARRSLTTKRNDVDVRNLDNI